MKFPTRKIRFFLITACLLMGFLYVLQETVRFGIAWWNSPTLLPYYPDASTIEFHLQPTLQYLSKFNPDLTGTPDYSPKSILARLKEDSTAAGEEVQKESVMGNREFEVMIVTSETLRDKEMRALPLQNRQAYAEKHRYSTYFNFHNYHPQYLRCLAWNKVLLLFQLVARFQTFSQSPQSPQWIWMLDYDILIMNQTLSLQDRILSHVQELRRERGQSMETCHLIISQDCLGINTGSMLVRVNSPWILDFLRLWWMTYNPDIPNILRFWEQASLQHMLKANDTGPVISPHIEVLEQKIMNSYPHSRCGHEYEKGDFLVHFAAYFDNISSVA